MKNDGKTNWGFGVLGPADRKVCYEQGILVAARGRCGVMEHVVHRDMGRVGITEHHHAE